MNDQRELTFEPDRRTLYRDSDPVTSAEAAWSLEDLRQSQRYVLAAFRARGKMTDQELIESLKLLDYKISDSGARTRRSELVTIGALEDSGEKKRTESGRRSIVWQEARR